MLNPKFISKLYEAAEVTSSAGKFGYCAVENGEDARRTESQYVLLLLTLCRGNNVTMYHEI
jgi:hypothetical protein